MQLKREVRTRLLIVTLGSLVLLAAAIGWRFTVRVTQAECQARLLASDGPILIDGPNGAGKELIARLIHQWSPHADKPLVVANCGGLTATLVETELFGHVKGAFTGAVEDR